MPVIEQLVDAGNNDARQGEDINDMAVSDSVIEILHNSDVSLRRWGAFRWVLPFNIPLGSTINVAFVELAGAPVFTHDVDAEVHFELATSPAPFSLTPDNIESRPRSTASTTFQASFGVSTAYQQSPSLVAALQELVDSFSPNALVVIVKPNPAPGSPGSFSVAAFENLQNTPARIHVEYTEPVIPPSTDPKAFITGTIIRATEDDVRLGGSTIIITLQGAVWAFGAAFTAARQAIIDGITSAGVELLGWNNEIRDNIQVADVIRTDDLTVTVSLPVFVVDYNITIPETVTVTVPDVAFIPSEPIFVDFLSLALFVDGTVNRTVLVTFQALAPFVSGVPDRTVLVTFGATAEFQPPVADRVVLVTFGSQADFFDGAPDRIVGLTFLPLSIFVDGTPDRVVTLTFGATFDFDIALQDKTLVVVQVPTTDDDIVVRDSPVPTFVSNGPMVIASSLAGQVNLKSAMRFDTIPIAVGSTVVRARFLFSPIGNLSGVISTKIVGELAGSPTQIISLVDYNSRFQTLESITYIEPSWVSNTEIVSRDFSKVIQEIVDQGLWALNNPLQLFWEPVSGALDVERTADSFDVVTAERVKLFLEFLQGEVDARLDFQIVATGDDVVVVPNTSFFSSNGSVVIAGDQDTAGTNLIASAMRFTSINILQGTEIRCAYITWIPFDDRAGVTVRTKLSGADEDDSAQITSFADFNGRARTTAEVLYNPPAWVQDVEKQSPDLKDIIQEIVDRPGWMPLQAMNIFWEDAGSDNVFDAFRQARSFEDSPLEAPKLTIFFVPIVPIEQGFTQELDINFVAEIFDPGFFTQELDINFVAAKINRLLTQELDINFVAAKINRLLSQELDINFVAAKINRLLSQELDIAFATGKKNATMSQGLSIGFTASLAGWTYPLTFKETF